MTEGIDHRALVAAIPAEDRSALTRLSDRQGAAAVALHLGAIAATGSAIALGAPFWWVFLLPHGVLVVFLFTLLHETTHRTVFRTTWPNRAVAALCGFAVLVPPVWFRYFHLAHHRHTHDPARDPELATPKPETAWQYALHVSGLPAWRVQIATLVANALGRDPGAFAPASAHARIRVEARVMLAGYAALAAASAAAGSTALVWFWVVPVLLGQPFLRLYLLAEHARCPHVANMLANTRTTFTNRFVRRLAWNMPYHAEHHAYPAVPFHQLPALHRIAHSHLQTTERGYVRFNRRYLAGTLSPEAATSAVGNAPARR